MYEPQLEAEALSEACGVPTVCLDQDTDSPTQVACPYSSAFLPSKQCNDFAKVPEKLEDRSGPSSMLLASGDTASMSPDPRGS